MNKEELRNRIAVSLIPGLGDTMLKRVIAELGGVDELLYVKNGKLNKLDGIGPYKGQSFNVKELLERADKEIEFMDKHQINSFFYLDKNYPERLRHCEDSPVIFFSKGKVDFNVPKIISVVGTRLATDYGKDFVNKLMRDLRDKGHNVIIVSGLAYGIDIAAHKAALDNGLDTIAVLGNGLKMIYPAVHRSIAEKIIQQGCIISDFFSEEQPERGNFIKRNRVIAGISDATIVIESGAKGGSLITANIANSYNRDVFAVPGRVGDESSLGCNKLIRTNQAALLEDVANLEYLLGWDKGTKNVPVQKQLFVELSNDERAVFEVLSKENLSIDIIALKLNKPVSKVSAILLKLEFSGLVISMPGNMYRVS